MTKTVTISLVVCFSLILCGISGISEKLYFSGLLTGSYFGVDETNRYFLITTGFAWACAALLAADTVLKKSAGIVSFAFVTTMIGNSIVVFSLDVVSFYLGFALMSLAATVLILPHSSNRRLFTAKVYIILAVIGEVILFAAMAGLYKLYGTMEFQSSEWASAPVWLVLCILFGFGIKAGVIPLHFTLPMVYRDAPVACGIAFSAAMLNAGILGWIRWMPAEVSADWIPPFIMVLGLVGYFSAAIVGLLQTDARALLGYSSISQVSLMVILMGVGLSEFAEWNATISVIAFVMLAHAVAKLALFTATVGKPKNTVLSFVWWPSIFVAGLSLAGAPLTAGYVVKYMLADALSSSEFIRSIASYILWLTSGFSALIMIRFYLLLKLPKIRFIGLTGVGTFVGLFPILLISVYFSWGQSWGITTLLISMIPILIAIILGSSANFFFRRYVQHGKTHDLVLAGDIVYLFTGLLRTLSDFIRLFDSKSLKSNNRYWLSNNNLRWVFKQTKMSEPRWEHVMTVLLLLIVLISISTMYLQT